MQWKPIESARKDGTYIWAVIGEGAGKRYSHWIGRQFQVRHEGKTESGHDLGWSLFPGFGGVSDEWFAGWMDCPDPPTDEFITLPRMEME